MSQEIETLVIASLVHRQDYNIKVFPHVKDKFFESDSHRTFFNIFSEYQSKYSAFPTKEAVIVEIDNRKGSSQEGIAQAKEFAEKVFSETLRDSLQKQQLDWLLDKSEKYLKDRSCFLAIMDSISIIEGENKKLNRDAIPDILKEALSISFDNNVGHDYVEDAESRFDFYHKKEARIPFSLTMLNKIVGGDGVPKKALIVPLAPTGVGKSLFLCNEAAHWLSSGRNVLYITLEMAEERIAERIDSNLMDITLNDLKTVAKSSFLSKMHNIQTKTIGKLIIKEYPPGTFNANHLRFLIQDLQAKKNFKPEIVIVDYLGLMASYRMKSVDNTYTYVKAVTEELRGVMQEYDMLGVSPTQTNREGQNNSDYDLNQMSESHGVSMTADMIFGLISTPEMEKIGRIRIKQLKNRFGDLNYYNSFLVGIQRNKMRLYDVEVAEQPAAATASVINSPKKETSGLKF